MILLITAQTSRRYRWPQAARQRGSPLSWHWARGALMLWSCRSLLRLLGVSYTACALRPVAAPGWNGPRYSRGPTGLPSWPAFSPALEMDVALLDKQMHQKMLQMCAAPVCAAHHTSQVISWHQCQAHAFGMHDSHASQQVWYVVSVVAHGRGGQHANIDAVCGCC